MSVQMFNSYSVQGDSCSAESESEVWLRRRDQRNMYSVATPTLRIKEGVITPNRREKATPTWREEASLFFQRTSLHGLVDIYRATNRTVRILWILIFFGAFGAAIFGCCAIVGTYTRAPIVASYFIKGMPSKFSLPDFIICPFNRFNGDFLRQHNVSKDLAQYMQLAFGAVTQHPYQRRALKKFLGSVQMSTLNEAMNDTLARMNMSFGDFLDAASLKCEDILTACTMPNGVLKCCNNATDIMTYTGRCYRIPGADQSGVGYGYGASMIIALPKNVYTLSVNNWLNDGVILQFAEPGRAVDYGLTFLTTGTHALMPLKAIRYEFIDDPPHFECLHNADGNYSILDCFENCVTEEAESACQCSIVTKWKKRTAYPACTTFQFYTCIVRYMQTHLGTDELREIYFYNCRQRCKPRCDYWQYQASMSYANFPFEEARPFAKTDIEWKKMQNTIILDVYYEKLEYTLIKHHRAMTVHGFIANLGGQYSLWLGGSILTLVQVSVFAVRYVFALCTKR